MRRIRNKRKARAKEDMFAQVQAVVDRDVCLWMVRNRGKAWRVIRAAQQLKPLHYASGSNAVGWINALEERGYGIGVAAPKVSPNAVRAMLGTKRSPIFVDSGAYSEMKFPKNKPPEVVKPMGPKAWAKVFKVYEALAPLGPRVSVVAPDRVADQRVTLERMRSFRDRYQALVKRNVRVLVPLQKGRVSLKRFHHAAAEALGASPESIIPAIPMKKDTTSDADLKRWAEVMKPRQVHLLGIGPRSHRAPRVVKLLREASPGIEIRLDSAVVPAAVGRGGGAGKLPRVGTQALDEATEALAEYRWGAAAPGIRDVTGWGIPDYTDAIGYPSGWLSKAGIRRIAKEARLTRAQTRAFLADPDGFLDEDDPDGELSWFHNQAIAYYLDEEWMRYRTMAEGTERKRQQMHAILESHRKKPKAGWYAITQTDAAPKTGEKGYRQAQDDAEHMIERGLHLMEDGQVGTALRQWYETGEWPEDTGYPLSEYLDDLGVPDVDHKGAPFTAQDREEIGYEATYAAALLRDEMAPKWLLVTQLQDVWDKRTVRLVAVPKKVAVDFVREHHSKLPAPNLKGLMYSMGIVTNGKLVAVALAGTPSGGWEYPHCVLELSRIASDGSTKGASSKLAARLIDLVNGWRTVRKGAVCPPVLVTYSLSTEQGTTYKALRDKGMRPVACRKGKAPTGARKAAGGAALSHITKVVWQAGPGAKAADWSILETCGIE